MNVGRSLTREQRRALACGLGDENVVVHADGRRELIGRETRGIGASTSEDGWLDVLKAKVFLAGGEVR